MEEQRRVLLVLSVAIGVTSLTWSNYSAVLPFVLEDLSLSATEGGIIYSGYFAGYLLVILPIGILIDRISARWVLGLAAIGTGVFGVAFATLTVETISGTFWRIAAGACFAGVYVPGMRILSDWYAQRNRGRAIGIYVGTLTIGSGAAYPLSTWIASVSDWRIAIALTSLPAILGGLLVIVSTSDHPNVSGREGGFEWRVLTDRSYLYVTTAYAGHNWELFSVQNWLVAFLLVTPAVAATGSPAVIAGLLAGIFTVMGGPGNAMGGWISDRIGRISTSGGALFASGTITIALGFLTWTSVAVLGLVLVIYGIVITADSVPLSTAVTEIVDDEHVGTALAGQSLIGFIPGLISPVVFGVALDLTNFMIAFATLVLGVIVAIVALGMLRIHLRGQIEAQFV